MGPCVGLNLFEPRRSILLEQYEVRVEKCNLETPEASARNPPETLLNSFVSAFREFVGITGISYLIESDLGILHIEAKGWESAYHFPRKQAEQIPASILETWETYVQTLVGI